MYDNRLQHKILLKLLEHKLMFQMKKDSFFSYENLAAYFTDDDKFSGASVKLLANEYIVLKKEDEIKKVNITEKGVFAVTSNLFLKRNSKLIWTAVKDYGMLVANIAVAGIALMALRQDNSKFVQRDEINELRIQVTNLQSTVDRLQNRKIITSTKTQNDTLKNH